MSAIESKEAVSASPEQREAAARAVMFETHCGVTINGKREFCDHPDLPEDAQWADCDCRRIADKVLAALKEPSHG